MATDSDVQTPEPPVRRGFIQRYWFDVVLWKRVLAALVLGTITGLVIGEAATQIKWMGDVFIRLIRMVVAPLVYAQPGYDAKRDFTPVSLVSRYKFALAVPASSPIKDVPALREWLRANPKQFTVGVPATGSLPHFFALMLGREIKQEPEVIGYRGSAPLISELIGGILPQGIDTLDTLLPQHRAGKIRILATSGDTRDADLQDVPTFKESGVDLAADGWNAFFAPAAMPKAKVDRLGADIAAILREPTMEEAVRAVFLEPVSQDAAGTAGALSAYRKQWEPVVRDSGFTATQ